jgi:hypothetical protein
MRKFMVLFKGCKLLQLMPNPPKGYVVLLTSISHENISKELNKWETALPSRPKADGKFDIYVSEEEWATYIGELNFSTR